MVLSSDFIAQRAGGSKIWVDPRLIGKSVFDAIADPDRLFERPDCRIIKDQRKIKVGRLALDINGISTGVYLKRYNAFSWRYRIGSLCRRSGARRSLLGALTLSRAGVDTGRPLAVVESRRWGLLKKSFFISQEIVPGKTADAYWREELKPLLGVGGVMRRRSFIMNIASLFRRLHDQHTYHNDLKDANILVSPVPRNGERFYLLDLEGIRRCCYLSRRRRIKNLVQLNRTLGKDLRRSERLRILKSYLGTYYGDRKARRHWVNQILCASELADRKSARKNMRRLARASH